ncbi:DUF6647 family protein [Roseivivax sediminis]|uniref:DUF6647 domain-containing protein n=1 Tax=Roseivivax sediminis TaxID=936889 RepID=A0A1I2C9Z8_9RHOB|nr:DUF6647 family protein [Roseivivax sediminis]SFE65025.1 hypothetical protein SAMN04515678_1135 [Roseivivax sediminis]
MIRSPFAVAVATALIALCPTHSQAETQMPVAAEEWQTANSLTALVASLDGWLDTQTDWPRRATPPSVRLVSDWQAAARQGATASFQRGRLQGLYDPEQSEILLVRPWNARNASDVGVLLHELTHHRQAPHHWYCPAAQELSAYQLQEAWLAAQGLSAEVNWMAVVLDAGCAPRDIHPD